MGKKKEKKAGKKESLASCRGQRKVYSHEVDEKLETRRARSRPAQLQAEAPGRMMEQVGDRSWWTLGLAHEELHRYVTGQTSRSCTRDWSNCRSTRGAAHAAASVFRPLEKHRAAILGGGCAAASSIDKVWSAMAHRHRLAELPFPLAQPLCLTAWFKAVAAIKGAPSRCLFPVGTWHARLMLHLIALSRRRNKGLCC